MENISKSSLNFEKLGFLCNHLPYKMLIKHPPKLTNIGMYFVNCNLTTAGAIVCIGMIGINKIGVIFSYYAAACLKNFKKLLKLFFSLKLKKIHLQTQQMP